jgi:hypothetical protein
VQAYQVNGTIAKHGYTVDWGFFNGVCQGSDAKPLEHDTTLTNALIVILRDKEAPLHDKRAADLRAGTVEPKFTREIAACHFPRRFQDHDNNRNFHRINIECARHELSDYDAQQQITREIYRAESNARNARSHASMLEKLIVERHGKPLVPVVDVRKDALCVGAKVTRNGKVCEIVEFTFKDQRSYTRATRSVRHAILKRLTDGFTFSVPTSTIRQTAILS